MILGEVYFVLTKPRKTFDAFSLYTWKFECKKMVKIFLDPKCK